MSILALAQGPRALPLYTRWLAWLFVAACAVGAVANQLFGSGAEHIFALLMLAAGLLVAAGLSASRRPSP